MKQEECDWAQRELEKELRILWGRLMNLEGIVKLIDCVSFSSGGRGTIQGLVYERGPEDLFNYHMHYCRRSSRMDRTHVKDIARQLLQALVVMHQHGIVHGGRTSVL